METCIFSMKVKGKKENVDRFKKILNGENTNLKMRGILNVNIEDSEVDFFSSEEIISVSGSLRWDVYTCMFDGENQLIKEDSLMEQSTTNILKESENLELEIEIYSMEFTVGFEEHFHIKNGEILVEDISKIYIENANFDDFETSGGFGEWKFVI